MSAIHWAVWYPHLRAWSLPLVALAYAALAPDSATAAWDRVENQCMRLARCPRLAVVAVAGLALTARIVALPWMPVPAPVIHDEFSYLLAADTFAHGRVTNPTPALWRHIETFHELMTPTYMSIYPPGQGLALALGQVLTGNPYWGVALSSAAMCGAILWALQAWVGAELALLAAWLAAVLVGPFEYWGNSYWGGAVAALGGALALGAAGRLRIAQGRALARNGAILGLGLAILANSRPYEGLVFALPLAACILIWLVRQPKPAWRPFASGLVPVLALAGAAMAYYCWRITGHPLKLPYLLFESRYEVAPRFLWQHLAPVPHYDFDQLRQLYAVWEVHAYQIARAHLLAHALTQAKAFYETFLWPLLTIPLALAACTAWRRRWPIAARWLVAMVVAVFAGFLVEVFSMPHYLAPATAAIFGCAVMALAHLYRHGRRGRALVRATAAASVLYFVGLPVLWTLLPAPPTWGDKRMAIVRQLQTQPGPQVVFVRYPPDHEVFFEWVFNAADLDAAKIVWARDMGAAGNAELLRHYPQRHPWLLLGDDNTPQLQPYAAMDH